MPSFYTKIVEYENDQFGTSDTFGMLPEKLREVIFKNGVVIPFHNLDCM